MYDSIWFRLLTYAVVLYLSDVCSSSRSTDGGMFRSNSTTNIASAVVSQNTKSSVADTVSSYKSLRKALVPFVLIDFDSRYKPLELTFFFRQRGRHAISLRIGG